MTAFLGQLKTTNPAMAEKLSAAGGASGALSGSPKFVAAWKKLAKDEPQKFFEAQHDFVKKTLYEPQASALKANLGIDVEKRSQAVKDVVWSISVQHGKTTEKIFQRALSGRAASQMSDRELIQAVYAERSKVDKYFSRSSPAVRDAVKKRFNNEEADALQMLGLPLTLP